MWLGLLITNISNIKLYNNTGKILHSHLKKIELLIFAVELTLRWTYGLYLFNLFKTLINFN